MIKRKDLEKHDGILDGNPGMTMGEIKASLLSLIVDEEDNCNDEVVAEKM